MRAKSYSTARSSQNARRVNRPSHKTRFEQLGLCLMIFLLSACQYPGLPAIPFLSQPTPTPAPLPDLVVYSTYDGKNKLPAFIAAFEAETGYKVKAESLKADEIVRRLSEEQNSPQVDILFGVPGSALIHLQTLGLLGEYTPASQEAKSGLDSLRPRLRDSNSPPEWIGLTAYATVFCVNTIELKKLSQTLGPDAPSLIPTAWNDLDAPIYRNEIILPDPTLSESGYTILTTLIQFFTTRVPKSDMLKQESVLLGRAGEVGAWDLIKKIDLNVIYYEDSGGAACQRVADGDATIAVSYDAVAFKIQKQYSDRLLVLFPAEGYGLGVEGMALVKKDQTHPAAVAFMDWALSARAMNVYEEFYALSTLRDSPLPYNANPLEEALPQRLAWESANRERLLNTWSEVYKDSAQTKRANRPPASLDANSRPTQP